MKKCRKAEKKLALHQNIGYKALGNTPNEQQTNNTNMTNKEIAHYVNNGARLEMANLLGYNKNGFHAIAISGADIGWDVHTDGSVTFVLFLDRKHVFHKQNVNAPLEYVRAA